MARQALWYFLNLIFSAPPLLPFRAHDFAKIAVLLAVHYPFYVL